MATVIGTSGAWRQVSRKLQSLGVHASHPREVEGELAQRRALREEQVARLPVQVRRELADLETQLQNLRTDSESRMASRRCAVEREVAQVDQQIRVLQAESGGLRGLLNMARLSLVSAKKKSLEMELQRFCNARYEEIANLQCQVERNRRDHDMIVDQRRYDLDRCISDLRAIALSGEMAGASAEIEIIDVLSMLPAHCVVLNDVRLEAERFMRFAGHPLQSAQIDHVVLTPQGVFVIEVKRWSAEFVHSQNYHDPFKQVSRARYLCQTLLRDHQLACKVRSLIATRGKMPEKPPDQYVKILSAQELTRYILWFKDPPLTDSEFRAVRRFLESRVCHLT